MAKKRMVSNRLWESKKAARVPERALIVYVMLMTFTDPYGRVEVDEDGLVAMASRYGRVRGWSLETLLADRDWLAKVGLIRTWGNEPDVFAEIVDFEKWNTTRPDREGDSGIPVPPWNGQKPVRGRASGRTTPDLLRTYSGPTPAQEEGEEQEEGEAEEEEVPRNSRSESPEDRLVRLWLRMHSELNSGKRRKVAPPRISIYEATTLVHDVPALGYFQEDDVLVAELRRVAACMGEKGFPVTFRGVVGQVGQPFPGTRKPNPVTWLQEENPKDARLSPEVANRIGFGMAGLTKKMPGPGREEER